MSNQVKTPGLDAVIRAKATFDGTAGYGAEMLPEAVSTEIIMRVWNESWARKTFRAVTMSTETQKVPKILTGISMYGTTGNKNVAATESRHGTDEVELSMKTIIANVPIDKKTVAYAVPTMMAALTDDIQSVVAETEEDIIINGDTAVAASNINGAYHVANYPNGIGTQDPRLELDGLRKFAAAGGCSVNASGAALTRAHILTAIACLNRYGKRKTNLIMLCSNSVEAIVLGWEELRRANERGGPATNVTGVLGTLYGMTVISTDLVPDTLNSSGNARSQADGVTANNRTVVLIINKTSPMIGNPQKPERKFKVETKDEPEKDQFLLIPKEDLAFANKYDEALCQIINVLPGCV